MSLSRLPADANLNVSATSDLLVIVLVGLNNSLLTVTSSSVSPAMGSHCDSHLSHVGTHVHAWILGVICKIFYILLHFWIDLIKSYNNQ